jgi:hypothetical protein
MIMGMDPTQLQQIVQESMAAVVPMEIDGDNPSPPLPASGVVLVGTAAGPGPEPNAPPAASLPPVSSAVPVVPVVPVVPMVPPSQSLNGTNPPVSDAKNPAPSSDLPEQSHAADGEAQADEAGAAMEDLVQDPQHDDNN